MNQPLPVQYVIYADESGDHGLQCVDPDYPVFVLAFCIFQVSHYIQTVVPSVQRFKFQHFNHDMVILHERDIRKSLGPFKVLFNTELREQFMRNLNKLVSSAKFEIVSCVVDKSEMSRLNPLEKELYSVAMKKALGIVRDYIKPELGDQKIPVIFESRGKTEDRYLISNFGAGAFSDDVNIADLFELIVANKKVNSSGLQIADMVARPLGQQWLKPDQGNKAVEIIQDKLIGQIFLP